MVAAAALLSFYPLAILWAFRQQAGGGPAGNALGVSALQQLMLALVPCVLMYTWEVAIRRRFLEQLQPTRHKKME
jgi:hypothetical protein